MAWKADGFSHEDIEEGFASVRACTSIEELEALIEKMPLLQSSTFHAFLRYEVFARAGSEDPLVRWYDEFFHLLHRRAHERFICAALENEDPPPRSRAQSFAPRYFQALVAACDGRIPASVDVPRRPDLDLDVIHTDLAVLRGAGPTLPAYQSSRGSRWSVLVVDCPRCEMSRLLVHAHFVDLAQAPDVADLMRSGTFNAHDCPRCGIDVFRPRFAWIQEAPGARDVLNGSATLWRVDEATLIYSAPRGSRHDPALNRVFEARLRKLLVEVDEKAQAPRSRAQSIAFAYRDEEWIGIMNERGGELPFAMLAVISEMTSRLQTGQLSPAAAEQMAAESVEGHADVQDWRVPVHRTPFDNDPYRRLAYCLVAEAVARAQREEPGFLLMLAIQTFHAYLSLSEVGLAERALARAEDAWKDVDPGPHLEPLEWTLEISRAELAVKHGDHHGAARIRRRLLTRADVSDTLADRMSRHQLGANLALNLLRTGEYAESLELFQRETSALEALVVEAEAAAAEEDRELAPTLKNSLSGTLANWSSLLEEIADHLELTELNAEHVRRAGQPGRDRPIPVRSGVMHAARRVEVEGLRRIDEVGRTTSALKACWTPVLAELMADDPREIVLVPSAITRRASRKLLERAIPIAESIGGWTFAGRQCKRLAVMQEEAGEAEAAEQTMQRALSHAARVRDHVTLQAAYAFLSDPVGRGGDGARALVFLRGGVREAMRDIVGRGFGGRETSHHRGLAYGALQCARFGASAVEAIAIAESLKGVSLGVSLGRGDVFCGEPQNAARREHLRALRKQRKELHLDALATPGSEMSRRLEELDRDIEASRREAIIRDPRYARWCDVNALDVSSGDDLLRRLKALGPRATYTGFYRMGSEVWVYAAWQGDAFVARLCEWPFSEEDERPHRPEEPPALDREKLAAWSAILLDPLRARLSEMHPDDPLILSLDEGLEHIPFAALRVDDSRLCELVTLLHVRGLGMLEECMDRETSLRSVLCIGDPYRPIGGGNQLLYAFDEVTKIARQFSSAGLDAKVLVGPDATVRAVQAAISKVDVVHFACHASFEESAEAALLLATDPEEKDSGDLSDKRILAELALKEGCLVNLAACSSDEQRSDGGPVGRGLVPAFLVAGAGAVLSSMWPLEDRWARRFQTAFYTRLLEGMPPAVALAETQRTCTAGRLGEEMKNPERWAGYRLWGAGKSAALG